MKESDAKSKWCPFAISEGMEYIRTTSFSITNAVSSINRTPKSGTALADCKCITTDCMAWVKLGSGSDGFCSMMDDNANGR